MTTASNQHQSYQPMPQLDTPLVDGQGLITTPWYRMIITLLKRTGCIGTGEAGAAGVPSIQNGIVLGQAQEGANLPISAYNAADGTLLGQIQLGSETGGPAQTPGLSPSPWVFTASLPGTLVVDSGKTEISRDGGAVYYPLALVGTAVPVLVGDCVRVSWTKAAPGVVFLPVGGLA